MSWPGIPSTAYAVCGLPVCRKAGCGGEARGAVGAVTDESARDFGGLLRQLRVEVRLTQEELAEAAGLSPRTVSDLERGVNRTAHKDTAGLLAEALGLTGPVRGVFVAAARGRVPVAEVLAARAESTGTLGSPSAPVPVPRELPADVGVFTGRAVELAELDLLLHDAPGAASAGGPVVISAVSGTAGVGKTALAVRWAHRVAPQFPDGQLYVNLRGYDPDQPVTASEALAGFLRALGVTGQDVPVEEAERAARYRSLLAGRRLLVVLDNAATVEQVRPLLPGTPSVMVVVTSRDSLAGLVARDGARRLDLDLLPTSEAVALLSALIGERAKAEPVAVEVLAEMCVRLPLALRVAAELAASRPDTPLAVLAAELGDEEERLALLDAGGDPRGAVVSVFSWSYRHLEADAARMFRLLGLHPGADWDRYATAALADVGLAEARRLLGVLARAHLIQPVGSDRYGMHDLLRAYARELADVQDAAGERRAAVHRILDYYLSTAYRAHELLGPSRDDAISLAPARPLGTPRDLADHHEALTWFTTEHQVLLMALRQAADEGFDVHVWQLAWTLASFFERSGHWHDAAASQRFALDAANRLSDPHAQAICHGSLAYACVPLVRYSEAYAHLRQALKLYQGFGDHTGQAVSHRSLAVVLDRQSRYPEGLDHARQAFELFRTAGHQTGMARTLNAVGWFHIRLGEPQQGLIRCQQALDLQREINDQFAQADTLDSIATAYRTLGRHQEAIAHYQQAVLVYRDFGHRYSEADTLVCLGDTHLEGANPAAAREAWRRALVILYELRHPDAAQVRDKLGKLAKTAAEVNDRYGTGSEQPQPRGRAACAS
jgi:tetratricopeptide (TPR) repeat protein/transcriptional regulator with XRE-family HTH domain